MPVAIRLCNTAALLLALTLTAACTRTDTHPDALAKYQKGDYQTARATWQRLAEQGLPQAQYWLGTLYRKGEGVKKDLATSARWLASAAAALHPLAEQGQPDAQYLLGLITRDGQGVEKNLDQSARWLRRAAEQGHVNAQHTLGLTFLHPLNEPRKRGERSQNTVEGEQWCRQAHDALLPLAEAGRADAQYHLGVLYRHGCGVAQDSDEYGRWLRRAARRGHVEAQYQLGAYQSSLLSKKRNLSEAADWTRKAAQKGHPAAQFRLALLYEIGTGVRHSQTEAERWYRKAAEQGDERAQKRLEDLLEKTQNTQAGNASASQRRQRGTARPQSSGSLLKP